MSCPLAVANTNVCVRRRPGVKMFRAVSLTNKKACGWGEGGGVPLDLSLLSII